MVAEKTVCHVMENQAAGQRSAIVWVVFEREGGYNVDAINAEVSLGVVNWIVM